MDLTHRFTVPTSVDETWAHFNDIASVAECFPGATVTSVEGETFSGSVKVKLGPIALVYNGSGTFVEKDEAAHRFVVNAKGKDKRGNGTAGANVTLTMADSADEGAGSTDVEVVTDLSITGKPAQFGRGVMQDVSDKLLGQFVACLEQRLSAGDGAADQDAEPASEPTGAAASTPSGDDDAGPASAPVAGVLTDDRTPTEPPTGAERPGLSRPGPRHAATDAQDDSIDLGATVLPVLAKTYWKQALGVLVVLALLWRWRAGRR